MNNFDLSVIVPVHNLEPYIQMLLDSFKAQKTNYKIEYIFVLDTCSDKTKERILAAELSNINFIECSVKSCGIARNLGVDVAHGKYIWFIDGDDWLLGDTVFEYNISSCYKADLDILMVQWATTPLWVDTRTDHKLEINPMVWQFIISKELIDKANLKFSDIQPNEDIEFTEALLKALKEYTGKMATLNKQVYFYNFGRCTSNMGMLKNTGNIEIK